MAAVLKVIGTAIAELGSPIFAVPKFWPVSGLTDSTVKLCVTVGAGAYVTPSPGWLAWIVQVPAEISVAVEPETVQTEGVVEVKLTGRPELAVAVNAIGTDVLIACAGTAPKVIVWAARLAARL